MRPRFRAVWLTLLVASAGVRLSAQTDIDTSILAGRILPPVSSAQPPAPAPPGAVAVPPSATAAMVGEQREAPTRPQLIAIPLFLDNDSLSMAQLTAGLLYATTRPMRATLSFSEVYPASSSVRKENYGAAVKWKFWSIPLRTALTFLSSYSDTRRSNRKALVGLVDEFNMGKSFTGGLDVRWVRKSATNSVIDLVPMVTLAHSHPGLTIATSYTFKNNVDGQSDYSVEFQVPTAPGVVVAAAGKHRTIRANLVLVFGPK